MFASREATNGLTPYFLPKYGKTYRASSLQEAVELAEKENK